MQQLIGELMRTFDLAQNPLRELNEELHRQTDGSNQAHWEVLNPRGGHAIAVGIDAPISVDVRGSVGYYCAGMNKKATVTVHGSAGPGVAENMMSGKVVIKGDASQYAGATGRGGLLVIEGNASSRCGISMKGIDIVGPIPAEIQNVTIYRAGLAAGAKEPEAGAALIRFLAAPSAAPAIKQSGMEPVSSSEIK